MGIEILEQFIQDFEKAGFQEKKIHFLDFYPHGDAWTNNPVIEIYTFKPNCALKWRSDGIGFESCPSDVEAKEQECFLIHDFERLLEGIDTLGYPDCGLDSCFRSKDGFLVADDWLNEDRFVWNEETDRVSEKHIY